MGDELTDEKLKQHLVGLEEKLTFQQRLIDEMSEVALSQQKQIDELEREIRLHRKSIQELMESQQSDLPHDKPPHY